MRTGVLIAIIGIGAAGLCAQPADAQPALAIDTVFARPSGWTVGVNPDGGCLSAATYRDGTTAWFGFTGDGQSVVAFTNKGWRAIQPSRRYQVELRARGRGNWRGTLTGMNRRGEPGLYALGLKTEFLVDLAAAGGMHIYFENERLAGLSLTGSAAALRATINCVKQAASMRADSSAGSQTSQAQAAVPQAPAPQAAAAPQPPKQQPSEPKSSSGTGFFVSSAGHVLTNQHVVNGCKTFSVSTPGAPVNTARLVASDSANDLALLKTDLAPAAVAAFDTRPRLGSSVYVYGFPLGGILATTGNFTSGAITATAGMGDDTRLLQISAPVQPGNSGGPVKDQNGNIVGVVVSKLNALRIAQVTNDVPQNVNFAIKAYIAINFLDSNGVNAATASGGKALDPADIADEAKKYTVRVTCE